MLTTGLIGQVKVEQLAHAEEILELVEPRIGRGPWRRDWLYRGQPSSRLHLRPRAMRDITVDHAGKAHVVSEIVWWSEPGQFDVTVESMTSGTLAHREFLLVRDFCDLADSVGIHVPGPAFPGPDAVTALAFPPKGLDGAWALATHAGVPTRFLDWTALAHVAMYFAAREAAESAGRGQVRPDQHFSVWALNTTRLDELAIPNVEYFTAEASHNAYLRAQSGSFTHVEYTGQSRGIPARLPDLDTVLRQAPAGGTPALVRYDVPIKEARTLLWLLDQRFISADRLFPSLEGIARAIQERRWHQIDTPKGERS